MCVCVYMCSERGGEEKADKEEQRAEERVCPPERRGPAA